VTPAARIRWVWMKHLDPNPPSFFSYYNIDFVGLLSFETLNLIFYL
jgi:hypothetical protein